LVVNEAMACGLPCIVSDRVGCGPDLVIPQKTGSIFRLGDVDALTKSILELAEKPERIISMGVEAKNRLRNYSVDTAVKGIIESLAATLGIPFLHANS
jgi:glycosyltransferase involved in cell wall biosynthesis